MNLTIFRRWFSNTAVPLKESLETKAEQGDANAQFSLGLKFANGKGPLDYARAAYWYLKAAEQSHTVAQFNLGVMYAEGQGIARDNVQAALWIDRAAHLGDAAAQYRLGITHHRASLERIPANASESRIQAYKWLRLADNQGYRNSDVACQLVTLQMTTEEVADAMRRVAGFVVPDPIPAAAR